MDRVAEFQKHAAECRALARGALNEHEKNQLMAMAQTWDSLAMQREESLSRHPELTRHAQKRDEVRRDEEKP